MTFSKEFPEKIESKSFRCGRFGYWYLNKIEIIDETISIYIKS